MRRLPLSAWLALLTVALVLAVVGALAPAAFALLGRLADENARVRVELAALGAVEALEREAEDAATGARLLAERPTLVRLVATGQRAELADFLERFRRTGGHDGCAVFEDGDLVAAAPADLLWRELVNAAPEGPSLGTALPGEEAPLARATAPVAQVPGASVLVIRRLGASVAGRLTEQVGLPVEILAVPPAGRGRGDDAYRTVLPADAARTAWVEVILPRSQVAATVAPLRRAFGWVALGASAAAVAAGVFAGRRLARPLRSLRRTAERIGRGDLGTPVPAAAGAELSALAATMEEMRQRLRDVTAELRLREAEAQALLGGIVEGVFAVDDERRIRYLNPQGAILLGVTAEEAIGRFCGDVLRPARGVGERRPCEERCPIVHARSRGASRAVEHLELASGRRTVVINSSPPAGPRQVQVMRDETETEAARRSRDAVLANVSHELKTPLSAQLASLELLRDGLTSLDAAAAGELVGSLERSTLRLTRLIDNLLESVRIETGQAGLRRLPVALAEVVAEAVAMTLPLFEQRRQRLEVVLPPTLPVVTGDAGQLTQVFVNLLANAQKFAPDASTVWIGGSGSGGSAVLWVEDAGPGVPASMSRSIFDRFHRAGGEREGMGLGLWIAKAIVERHGGGISVASSSAGGARFTLTFPAAEAA